MGSGNINFPAKIFKFIFTQNLQQCHILKFDPKWQTTFTIHETTKLSKRTGEYRRVTGMGSLGTTIYTSDPSLVSLVLAAQNSFYPSHSHCCNYHHNHPQLAPVWPHSSVGRATVIRSEGRRVKDSFFTSSGLCSPVDT